MAQGATSTCSHVAVAFQMKTGLQTRDFQFNIYIYLILFQTKRQFTL